MLELGDTHIVNDNHANDSLAVHGGENTVVASTRKRPNRGLPISHPAGARHVYR